MVQKYMHWFKINFDVAFGMPVGEGCTNPEKAKAAFIKALEAAGVDFEWSGPSNAQEHDEQEAGKPLIEWTYAQDVLETGYKGPGVFEAEDARYEITIANGMTGYPTDDQLKTLLSSQYTKQGKTPGLVGKYLHKEDQSVIVVRPNARRRNLTVAPDE